MDAKDLRIGNWVVHEPIIDDWEEIIVKCGNIIQCEISPDSFAPIPITEEHLFKFGFDKLQNDIPTYYKCFGNLIEDDYEFSFNIYVDSEQNYFITVFGRKIIIKYLHQLQNLYFGLTEEELIIQYHE